MACIGNRISGEKTKKLVSVCLTSFFLGCLAAYSQKKTLPFGDVSFWGVRTDSNRRHSEPQAEFRMSHKPCIHRCFRNLCLQKRTRGILRNGSSCVLLVASDKSITLFTCKTRTLFPSSLHHHSLLVQGTG